MHPFQAPGLTYRQFADLLRANNVCHVARLEDPSSDGTSVFYRFTRIDGGMLFDITEYVEDDTWPMMGSTFRSLCARLGVEDVTGGTH